MKTEVAKELPKRTDIVLEVDFSEEEQKIYDAVRLSTHEKILNQMTEGSFFDYVGIGIIIEVKTGCMSFRPSTKQEAETSSKNRNFIG